MPLPTNLKLTTIRTQMKLRSSGCLLIAIRCKFYEDKKSTNLIDQRFHNSAFGGKIYICISLISPKLEARQTWKTNIQNIKYPPKDLFWLIILSMNRSPFPLCANRNAEIFTLFTHCLHIFSWKLGQMLLSYNSNMLFNIPDDDRFSKNGGFPNWIWWQRW